MIRKFFLLALVALVIIQFFHPPFNNSAENQANYIGSVYPVSPYVQGILKKACLDCHSNNTNYPWYAKVQPVHWWLHDHIREGKKELNLDEFTNRSPRYQYRKLEEIIDQVDHDKMPLASYTWIHTDAKLTLSEKETLKVWADSLRHILRDTYPPDSLERKKRG